MSIKLVLPFDQHRLAGAQVEPAVERRASSTLELPENAVLALINNGKNKADVLLQAIARNLQARGLIAEFFMHSKKPSDSITDAERDAIVARADMVISGVGDCGGCTACSTSDAIRCMVRGVPAFMLATTKFAFLVEAADREYGVEGLNRLFVEHPVWSRSDAWLDAAASQLADEIVSLAVAAPAGASAVNEDALPTIETALGELRAGMDADGYDMTSSFEDGQLLIAVTKRAGAGEACLIPEEDFGRLVSSLLERNGLAMPAQSIRISYPVVA